MLRRKVDCEYAKGLVEAYFTILTQGCGNSSCTNGVCRSNPAAHVLSPNDAAIQSIVLAVESPMAICLSVPPSISSFHPPTSPTRSTLPPRLELEVPETDDDDDATTAAAPSTPRKRLTTAVLLDSSINVMSQAPLRQAARSVPKKGVASSMMSKGKNLRAASPMKQQQHHQRAVD